MEWYVTLLAGIAVLFVLFLSGAPIFLAFLFAILAGIYFIPRFRSEVHHRQALFEMRAQARMKKGPGGENFDRRSLR